MTCLTCLTDPVEANRCIRCRTIEDRDREWWDE